MIKKVYTMRTVTMEPCAATDWKEMTRYYVVRNYKNGKSRVIGRAYKTHDGAMRQVRHRNACHYDRYATCYVRY